MLRMGDSFGRYTLDRNDKGGGTGVPTTSPAPKTGVASTLAVDAPCDYVNSPACTIVLGMHGVSCMRISEFLAICPSAFSLFQSLSWASTLSISLH